MTKAGMIRAVFPRRPQNGWKLKRVTVEKARTGRYYAYVLYESLVQPPEPVLPAPERTLGLKYSLRHFYVDDQGNQVTNTYDVSTAQMNYYYFQLCSSTRTKQRLRRGCPVLDLQGRSEAGRGWQHHRHHGRNQDIVQH